MDRIVKKISFEQLNPHFSKQILIWTQKFETFAWLDSNDYPQTYSTFQRVLAIGVQSELKADFNNAFSKLDQYQKNTKDFIFGYLSYDLKNDIEELNSQNFDGLHFPDLYFFQPEKLFFFHDNYLEIHYWKTLSDQIEKDLIDIQNTPLNYPIDKSQFTLNQRITKEKYFEKFEQIKKHILRGDSYEANFCLEFYTENITINPYQVFNELNTISQTPFAVFFKHKEHFLLSASPERFVRKEGKKIITQPIKGTTKRSPVPEIDQDLKIQLEQNEKERSENIMIVDLVRNDLSKTASKGSVSVEELCRVYTFQSVHQLVSTVVSEVNSHTSLVQVVKSLFPMGSMTGAPKISTMKLIEELEETKRSLYSGAFGYFDPNEDFDFNVVIRSVLYNKESKYLSYSVGGAITAKSNAQNEYDECLLKAQNIQKTLNKFLI
jgi:para-aminobenzoate synthetase component 1